MISADRHCLETLYKRFNRREFIHPDPLEFLYNYQKKADREIVGLIASSLAYGRVAQILKSVSIVLDKMGSSPFDFLMGSSNRSIEKALFKFKHRFTTGREIVEFLGGVKDVILRYGSLEQCFKNGIKKGDDTFIPALSKFVDEINGGKKTSLMPLPELGSACKRLNLYLRWMVRKDDVDPGVWKGLPASKLVVPLDTHMYKIGRKLRFTKRKQADIETAVEITNAFSKFSVKDPVKYDFALTRIGIIGKNIDSHGAGGLI